MPAIRRSRGITWIEYALFTTCAAMVGVTVAIYTLTDGAPLWFWAVWQVAFVAVAVAPMVLIARRAGRERNEPPPAPWHVPTPSQQHDDGLHEWRKAHDEA